MTIDITKEIQEAIRKNLPTAVGEELQKVLEEGKKAIEENKSIYIPSLINQMKKKDY